MKEAMSSLNKVLNKPQVPEDDYDRYGKILANKLRKLSELESQTIMYEIVQSLLSLSLWSDVLLFLRQ